MSNDIEIIKASIHDPSRNGMIGDSCLLGKLFRVDSVCLHMCCACTFGLKDVWDNVSAQLVGEANEAIRRVESGCGRDDVLIGTGDQVNSPRGRRHEALCQVPLVQQQPLEAHLVTGEVQDEGGVLHPPSAAIFVCLCVPAIRVVQFVAHAPDPIRLTSRRKRALASGASIQQLAPPGLSCW